MPFYDYTSKKGTNKSEFKSLQKSNNQDLEDLKEEMSENKDESVQYKLINPQQPKPQVQPIPMQNVQKQLLPPVQTVQRTGTLINGAPTSQTPLFQYRVLNSSNIPPNNQGVLPAQNIQSIPLQPIIVSQPILQKKPAETRSVFVSTDDVQTMNKGTQIERDLVKLATKAVNTDLKADQLHVKHVKPQVNYFNEGFRAYYDDEADVNGVMCFLCWANCCGKCNNICKGCRNTISCPVYCWICFIIPVFIILIIGIIVALLFGFKVIVV